MTSRLKDANTLRWRYSICYDLISKNCLTGSRETMISWEHQNVWNVSRFPGVHGGSRDVLVEKGNDRI